MNRKGFTVMELLTIILLLGIVLTIASPSLINIYKSIKLKSEESFVNRLSQTIDSYVKLNSSELSFNNYGKGTKTEDGSSYNVNLYKDTVTIADIINDKLLLSEDYVNAGNKEVTCNTNGAVEIYKDSDYVYCYKVKKELLGCLSQDYKDSIAGDYAINTCIWEEVE